MISPELLRRFPFFGCLDDAQQKAVSMIAEEASFAKGAVIFREGEPASSLYLLLDGSVTISIAPTDEPQHQLAVDDVAPGEPFGITAMLPEKTYSASAQSVTACRAIRLDAAELGTLVASDWQIGHCVMYRMLSAAMERVQAAYVQLAAAQV
jgi:CRP-like cAMP-binding protein